MRLLPVLALLALPAALPACSGPGGAGHVPVTPSEASCVCGTPEGDLNGCLDDLCLAQVGNAQNPDCFCAARTRSGDAVRLGPTATSFVSVSLEQSLESIRMLELADGTKVRGKVLSDTGGLVRFQQASGEVVEYDRADLAPRSHYSLEKARVEDGDGAGQLRLAGLAGECGLLSHARRHLAQAERADPALAPQVAEALAGLRSRAAEEQLALAEKALAEGRTREARRGAGAALRDFGDEEWVLTRADAVIAAVDAADAEVELARADDRARQQLAPARELVAKARKQEQEGLKAGSKLGTAISRFESGLRSGESARKQVARFLDEKEKNAVLREGAAVVDRQAVEVLVDLHLHVASAQLVRNSHQKALGEANAALALAPSDPAAIEMRRRIEVAANERGWGDGTLVGLGWRGGGRLR